MLILLCFLATNVVIPQLTTWIGALTEQFGILLILGAALVLMMASIGVNIHQNLGSTLVGGMMRGFGFILMWVLRGIGWLFLHMVILIQMSFRSSRVAFRNMGLGVGWQNFLALLVAILTTIAII